MYPSVPIHDTRSPQSSHRLYLVPTMVCTTLEQGSTDTLSSQLKHYQQTSCFSALLGWALSPVLASKPMLQPRRKGCTQDVTSRRVGAGSVP